MRPRVATLAPRSVHAVASLRFALPRPSLVAAFVLDAAGAIVHTLCEAELEPGEHLCSWDGLDVHGRRFAAGTYTLKLEANGRLLCARIVTLQ
ncbi:MAG: FlgD immunoglobulin-like domain containing protein [Candidatus Eisenbacteria bacterium]